MSSEALHFSVSVGGQARPRDPATGSGYFEAPPGSTQNLADLSDEKILVQLADGMQDALAILFRRHSRAVHNIAYRIVRDTAEAEDLVQEVFLFVFRKAGLFDPTLGTARSWLMQVTYHRAFDRRRHLTSRRFYTHLKLEEGNLPTEELEARVTSYVLRRGDRGSTGSGDTAPS